MTMQFGQPVRSATEDANSGNIDPPALRTTPRDKAIEKGPKRSEWIGALDTGSGGLAGALTGFLGDKATASKARKEQEAKARTGLTTAISEQDEKMKRADWASAVFGENPSYAAAQQQAVRNGVNQSYLQLASSIDEHATTHPDEFREKVMGDLLTGLTDKYKDPQTVQNATNEWLQKVEPLVAKQYESWYGNSLIEQYNEAKRGVGLKADYFNFSLADALESGSERKVSGVYNEAVDYFNGTEKPDSMSHMAWRRSINETMQEHLRSGNVQFYQLAKQVGYLDQLGEGEQKQLQQALTQYDTQFARQVNASKNQYWTAIHDVELDNIDEAVRLTKDFQDSLSALESRSTGSPRAKESLWGAHSSAASYRKGLNKTLQKAKEEAAKGQAETTRFSDLQAALRGTPDTRSGGIFDAGASTQDIKAATDANLLEDIEDVTGSERGDLSLGDAAKRIMLDPEVAQVVADTWSMDNSESDLIKTVAREFMGGWMKWEEEDGTLSEDGQKAFESMNILDQDKKFRNTIGGDNHDRWLMLQQGINNGKPIPSIIRDMELFEQNLHNKNEYVAATNWPYNRKDSSKFQYIEDIIKHVVPNPNTGVVNDAMDTYTRGLVMWKGDHNAAREYLRNTVGLESASVYGSVIPNGSGINTFTSRTKDFKGNPKESTHNLETVLRRSGKNNQLAPFMALLVGKKASEDIPNDLSSVHGLQISTREGFEGIVLDSPSAVVPVEISKDMLQRWQEEITQEDYFNSRRRYNYSELLREHDKTLQQDSSGLL